MLQNNRICIVCVTEVCFAGEWDEYPLREERVFEAILASLGRRHCRARCPARRPSMFLLMCVQLLGLLHGVTSMWVAIKFYPNVWILLLRIRKSEQIQLRGKFLWYLLSPWYFDFHTSVFMSLYFSSLCLKGSQDDKFASYFNRNLL
jgi:hypothetical protein